MVSFIRIMDRVLAVIASLALIAMMLLMVLNAIARRGFQAPIENANEVVAQWFLPIMVLLAIPSAQVWKEHLNVSLVTDKMSAVSLRLTKIVGFVLGALLCIALTWFGWGEAMHQMSIKATAGITDLPVWPLYFLVPVGMAATALVLIVDAFLTVKNPTEELNTGTGQSLLVQPDGQHH